MHAGIFEHSTHHESGRVLYAYKHGYNCESMEPSANDPGGGVSKLNGGADTPLIQALLSGNSGSIAAADLPRAVEIALKLYDINCAATCAGIFFSNEGRVTDDTEIVIPGQDMKFLQRLDAFLNAQSASSPGRLNSTLSRIFSELKKDENWQPILMLAKALLDTEEKKITRFTIEDALMKGGFHPRRPQASGERFNLGIREDEGRKTEKLPTVAVNPDETLLNKSLKDFLRLIDRPLNEDEIDASVNYLKLLFRKSGHGDT